MRFKVWVKIGLFSCEWQPPLVFLLGKSHGQRSLSGYSPWGRKESDTTEQLHFILYFLWNPQASFHCSLLGESICDLWIFILSSKGHLQGHWSLRISYSFPWKVMTFRRAQVNSQTRIRLCRPFSKKPNGKLTHDLSLRGSWELEKTGANEVTSEFVSRSSGSWVYHHGPWRLVLPFESACPKLTQPVEQEDCPFVHSPCCVSQLTHRQTERT